MKEDKGEFPNQETLLIGAETTSVGDAIQQAEAQGFSATTVGKQHTLLVDDSVRVLGSGGGGKSVKMAQIMAALAASGVNVDAIPGMPKPKPVKVLTGVDIQRIKAAEAKRKRKADKRAGISHNPIVLFDEDHIPMGR